MDMEEYHLRRLFTVAQMAAALEAGDRANPGGGAMPKVDGYAHRALALFDACSDMIDAQNPPSPDK